MLNPVIYVVTTMIYSVKSNHTCPSLSTLLETGPRQDGLMTKRLCSPWCKPSSPNIRFHLAVLLANEAINPLKTNGRLMYLKTQFDRAVNTIQLGYKTQSVYAVSGTSRC